MIQAENNSPEVRPERVLLVDDDEVLLKLMLRPLRKRFTMSYATSAEQGLALLRREGEHAVVISDIMMPGMNGIEFLARVRDLSTLMLTVL